MKLKIVDKKLDYWELSFPAILKDARSKAVHLNEQGTLKLYIKLQDKIIEHASSKQQKKKAETRLFKANVLLELITIRRN